MSSSVPLRILFLRALNSASKASKLPTVDKNTQELVIASLRDLSALAHSIDVSGMFSSNETLEDIPTRHLPYLLVAFVIAETESKIITLEIAERIMRLKHSQRYMKIFLDRLRQYEVIPEDEKKLYSQKSSGSTDPVKRRELKIKQFKQEKVLRSTLETLCVCRGQPAPVKYSGDDLDMIASLLPASSPSEEEQADDDDEALRQVSLLVIRLIWAHAQSQIESMENELELLLNVPSIDPKPSKLGEVEDINWRLDPSLSRAGADGKGPLMDSTGKPLRPFTILPASSQRSRFQAEVFRPDHRLPTLTVDEYLEEEQRRGNIITGGGPQSQLETTLSEQLELDSEMDGTAAGEQKAEEKREKDEGWARYTDLHPKGEGNTMNRG